MPSLKKSSYSFLSTTVQPKPPIGGIPKRKTPRWIRWIFRLIVFPFMLLDWFVQSLIKRLIPPPYTITGQCKKRGNCCHYILMHWPSIMDKIPPLGQFWLWWNTEILSFYLRGFEVENVQGDAAHVMSCRDLREDGTCGNYFFRPLICRQWPRTHYDSLPFLLKGCGYSYELHEGYEDILEDIRQPPTPLTNEKKGEIREEKTQEKKKDNLIR